MVEQARLFAESFHQAVAKGTDAAFRDFLRNRVAVGFNPVMTASKEKGGLGFEHFIMLFILYICFIANVSYVHCDIHLYNILQSLHALFASRVIVTERETTGRPE